MPVTQPNDIVSLLLPTTKELDASEIYETDVSSDEFKELIVRLYQAINSISIAVNSKDSGYLPNQESISGVLLFGTTVSSNGQLQYRPGYRVAINCGALPNTGSNSIAHGISIGANYRLIKLYGGATTATATSMIPLPFASPTLSENIKLEATGTNIVITTGSNRSSYTTSYVVMEYVSTV